MKKVFPCTCKDNCGATLVIEDGKLFYDNRLLNVRREINNKQQISIIVKTLGSIEPFMWAQFSIVLAKVHLHMILCFVENKLPGNYDIFITPSGDFNLPADFRFNLDCQDEDARIAAQAVP